MIDIQHIIKFMFFYEVWVRSNHYHGNKPLTYSSTQKIVNGQLVIVPLKNELVPAIVTSQTAKLKMSIKEVVSILDLPPLPKASLQLMKWIKNYYPSPIGIITQLFIPATLSVIKTSNASVSSRLTKKQPLPILNKDQQQAIQQMQSPNTYLLHGRTGSGKTRIYIELAKQQIAKGKSVIILTPEISLTTQLETQFNNTFWGKVILLHSNLSPKQRYENWLKILTYPNPKIVLGPRSAIFSPIDNIGLIVIDEEHEPAYKQEQSPYYQTVRVASQLRNIHQSKLILGSATPLINDYFLAQSLNKPIIRLNSLAQTDNTAPLETLIVDKRDHSLFNRSNNLSQPLIESIELALKNNQQTLLYLNRRGTARVIICEECDWQAKCPKCDLPLTYHGDNHNLRCHVCGYINSAPTICPQCHNLSIKYLTIGTKAVVDEVSALFPTAKIMRFDTDNLKAERLEQHYQKIKDGQVDIIIGTQMLAKGLDLPKLAVVGVLLADTSLQLPDYTVNERTYQLLHQVIGRVGRGHIAGKAIIQTYQPNNPVISQAINDNWQDFYNQEVKERKTYDFPPFVHLLKLTILRANPKSAQNAALKLSSLMPKNVKVEGPSPAFHEKQANKYKWQLIIKSSSRHDLLDIIDKLPAGIGYDIDPSTLI